MRVEEHGRSLGAKRLNDRADIQPPNRVKSRRRLVKDDKLRIRQQRLRQTNALLHALRVGSKPLGTPTVHPNLLQHFGDPPATLGLGHAVKLGMQLQ